MTEPLRVVHLAIDHKPLDGRIFEKECRTLAGAGYEVHLVVPGAALELVDGVHFHSYLKSADGIRPLRIFRRLRNAYRAARRLRADLYHFHECGLTPVGLCLKLGGAMVVYDVHEDFPLDALALYRGRPLRAVVSFVECWLSEAVGRRVFDGFVAATPAIARRFPRTSTALVQNYPRLADFPPRDGAILASGTFRLAYAGGLTAIRGIGEIVAALGLLPPSSSVRLTLLGEFFDERFARQLETMPGWSRVDYFGFQPRGPMVRHLFECQAGLVLFHPDRSHVAAQPNKLFEYMAAGMPVIASDFPLWRQIIEQSGCGILVDPLDPAAIADAIAWTAEHPKEAVAMGERGRAAAMRWWNWERESQRLLGFYAEIAGRRRSGHRFAAVWGQTR